MTVLVAAGVITRGDGRILLTQRLAESHLGGAWEFPGGKVEAGEDPRETVVRECREECAIEVAVDDILEVTFHRYPEKDVLLLFYRARLVAGDVRHLGVADHAWVVPKEVADYPLPPADVAVVAKLQP